MAAAAIIDRLLHYSTTINIRGESYPPQGQEAGRRLQHAFSDRGGPLNGLPGEFHIVDL